MTERVPNYPRWSKARLRLRFAFRLRPGGTFLPPNRGDDRRQSDTENAHHGNHEKQQTSRELVALIKAVDEAYRCGDQQKWFGDSHNTVPPLNPIVSK
jgi:hypothetical protein